MFGLIKQLAKLITIAKNLPKLLTLVPKLLGSPRQLASTLALGLLGNKITKMIDTSEEQQLMTISSLQSDAQEEIDNIRNSNVPIEQQQQLVTQIEINRDRDIADVQEGFRQSLLTGSQQMIDEKVEAIEPSIMSAIAPFALAIGIPTGLTYVLEKFDAAADTIQTLESANLSSITPDQFGETVDASGIVDAESAESQFNSDINAAEAEDQTGEDASYPVGRKYSDKPLLNLYSVKPTIDRNVVFRYNDDGIIETPILIFAKNNDLDDGDDGPVFQLKHQNWGVGFPNSQQQNIQGTIDQQGKITFRWLGDDMPNFDSDATYHAEAWIKEEKTLAPDERDRAFNEFKVLFRFNQTFPN